MTEGTLTCVVSFILYFTIADFPEEVTWLSQEEKEFVKARLYEDVGHSKRHDPLTPKSVLEVFKDCECSSSRKRRFRTEDIDLRHREDYCRRVHVPRSHRPRVRLR